MSNTINEVIETGRTIEEATEKGLAALGLSRLDADVEVLSRETKGFLGLGSSLARVRVSEKLTPEKVGAAYLSELLHAMGVKDFAIETVNNGEVLQYIVLSPEDMGFTIGYHGDALDAISTVVALAVSKAAGNFMKAMVDINGYREKRLAVLKDYANKAAEKASQTGYVTVANPMKPYERMILHSTVQDYSDVVSWSEGDEPRRRVIIAPISKVQKVGDRYERTDRVIKTDYNRSGSSFKSGGPGGRDSRHSGNRSYGGGSGGRTYAGKSSSSPAQPVQAKKPEISVPLYGKVEIPKKES